jgi:hypothetical protein
MQKQCLFARIAPFLVNQGFVTVFVYNGTASAHALKQPSTTAETQISKNWHGLCSEHSI